MNGNYFKGRKLLIASMHEKENAIAPILEKALGVYCYTGIKINTDAFGTFSGEVKRTSSVLSVLREKCNVAMQTNHSDLCVASEGSFGQYPYFPSVSCDEEFVILVDQTNKIEVVAKELSLSTNFNAAEINNYQELRMFAKSVKFPSHGLILRKAKNDFEDVFKGIVRWDSLQNTFNFLLAKYQKVYVETDMRAMYNPTRMKVIRKATQKLVKKLKTGCPNCQFPGFEVSEVVDGLPCNLCSNPTQSTLKYIYQCKKCSFQKEELYPKGKQQENPMYCNFCNP